RFALRHSRIGNASRSSRRGKTFELVWLAGNIVGVCLISSNKSTATNQSPRRSESARRLKFLDHMIFDVPNREDPSTGSLVDLLQPEGLFKREGHLQESQRMEGKILDQTFMTSEGGRAGTWAEFADDRSYPRANVLLCQKFNSGVH